MIELTHTGDRIYLKERTKDESIGEGQLIFLWKEGVVNPSYQKTHLADIESVIPSLLESLAPYKKDVNRSKTTTFTTYDIPKSRLLMFMADLGFIYFPGQIRIDYNR
jgi:hypothetical protein